MREAALLFLDCILLHCPVSSVLFWKKCHFQYPHCTQHSYFHPFGVFKLQWSLNYWLQNRGFIFWFPPRVRVSSVNLLDRFCDLPVWYRRICPWGVKLPVKHSSPSSSKLKYEWSFISTLTSALMACTGINSPSPLALQIYATSGCYLTARQAHCTHILHQVVIRTTHRINKQLINYNLLERFQFPVCGEVSLPSTLSTFYEGASHST